MPMPMPKYQLEKEKKRKKKKNFGQPIIAGIEDGISHGFSRSYGHRLKSTRHPVRSAISKLQIARLVLEWVTIWEPLVL